MKFISADILNQLQSQANPINVEGMARFGINPQGTLGISMPVLRQMAKEIGKDHQLAGELWVSGLHEARILASLVDKPSQVDEQQMERWAADFDSWDVCDQVCGNLFWRSPQAPQKAMQWSGRQEEFVKRAGFVLMAELAVHDKKAGNVLFESFFVPIAGEASDERNFVKKAVNWALRSIGKRNLSLNEKAIAAARQVMQIDSKTARWIAADALKELSQERIQNKLRFSLTQELMKE